MLFFLRKLILFLIIYILSFNLSALPIQKTPIIFVETSSNLTLIPKNKITDMIIHLLNQWHSDEFISVNSKTMEPNWSLNITLSETSTGLEIKTILKDPIGEIRTEKSWLPPYSLSSIIPTILGCAYRSWTSFHDYPKIKELGPPPVHSGFLETSTLKYLSSEFNFTHISDVAFNSGKIFILSEKELIVLGSQLKIVEDTALWQTWDNATTLLNDKWQTIHPLGENQAVLVSEELNKATVINPHLLYGDTFDISQPVFEVTSQITEPINLISLAKNGTTVWHKPGNLAIKEYNQPVSFLKVPPGTISYLTSTTDANGFFWTYDKRELRIRVLSYQKNGTITQVFTITPALPRKFLNDIQTLALGGDGSILIGSRNSIWKIDYRGIPIWSLQLLRTSPKQLLPSAFTIKADQSQPSFIVFDKTTQNIHQFTDIRTLSSEDKLLEKLQDASLQKSELNKKFLTVLTDKTILASQDAEKKHYMLSAQRLLNQARLYLTKLRIADPLSKNIIELQEQVTRKHDTLQSALSADWPFDISISNNSYHPEFSKHYAENPLTINIDYKIDIPKNESLLYIGLQGTGFSQKVFLNIPETQTNLQLPIKILPNQAHSIVDLSQEKLLWLKTYKEKSDQQILTSLPLITSGISCIAPEMNYSTSEITAFMSWQVSANDSALTHLTASYSNMKNLTADIINIASITSSDSACPIQSPLKTLATLSGSSTDWVIALALISSYSNLPTGIIITENNELMTIILQPDLPNELSLNTINNNLINKIIAQNENLKAPNNFGLLTAYLPSPLAKLENNHQKLWQEAGKKKIIEMTKWKFIPITDHWTVNHSTRNIAPSPQSPFPIILPIGISHN